MTLYYFNSNLFAGTNDGMFISTDNGTNWNAINTGLTNTFIRCIAVKDDKIFVGTTGSIYLSTDDGANWSLANIGLPGRPMNTIIVKENYLFVGITDHGVLLFHG